MSHSPIPSSLERYGEHLKRGIHTVQPATIERYNLEKRTVDVKPVITDYLKTDGQEPINLDWGIIPDCPVWYLGGGGFIASPPLKKGDPCLIIHCQRPIDEWWQSDGQTDVTPQLMDTHSETDCFVLAGKLMPQGAIICDLDADDFLITHDDGSVEVRLKPDGEVQIKATKVRMGTLTANKALALAEKVESSLNDIKLAFNTHVHAGVVTGPGSSLIPSSLISTTFDVKSETVFSNA